MHSEWHFVLLSLQITLHLFVHHFRVKYISIRYCVSWYVEIWASTLGRLLEVAPVFRTFPIHWSCYFMRYCSLAFIFRLLSESANLVQGCIMAVCPCILLIKLVKLHGISWGILSFFCSGSRGTQHIFRTLSMSSICPYHVCNCLICVKLSINIMLFWRPFPLIFQSWFGKCHGQSIAETCEVASAVGPFSIHPYQHTVLTVFCGHD
jgi:hypothetical protein